MAYKRNDLKHVQTREAKKQPDQELPVERDQNAIEQARDQLTYSKKHLAHMPELMETDRFPLFWKLTMRQQMFLVKFLSGFPRFNATQAYLDSGLIDEDESDIPREQVASRANAMKNKPSMQAALQEVMAVYGLSPEFVTLRLGEIAAGVNLADLEPYINGEKTLQDLRNEGVNIGALSKARQTVEKDGSEHRQVEVSDSMPAIKEIAKILGMSKERHDVTLHRGRDYEDMTPEELAREEHALQTQLQELNSQGDDE